MKRTRLGLATFAMVSALTLGSGVYQTLNGCSASCSGSGGTARCSKDDSSCASGSCSCNCDSGTPECACWCND